MRAHLQYLSYVLRHKWFVLLAGRKTKAPLWRLIIHDWSKFSIAEWGPYVTQFYKKGPKDGVIVGYDFNAFDRAWLHHQHKNPHHWQHWVLRKDDGTFRHLPMPEKFVREMVADWMGAGRAINGTWDARPWYAANQDKILLNFESRTRVVELLGECCVPVVKTKGYGK